MNIKTLISLAVAFAFSMAGVRGTAAAQEAEDVSFRYRSGKTEIESAVKPNGDNLAKLDAILSGPRASSISRIELRAASSPNGPTYLNKQYAHERAQAMMDFVASRYPSIPASVWQVEEIAEDWDGVISYFKRSKKDYKEEALKIVRDGAANREELLKELYAGEAWDDLINYSFPYLRTVKLHIVFAGEGESTAEQEIQTDTETEPTVVPGPGRRIVQPRENAIYFNRAGRTVKNDILGNSDNLDDIREMVKDLGADSLLVEAFASPEGSLSVNNRLTKQRAEAVREVLSRQMGVPASQISIRAMGEDWNGFRDKVVAGYNGADREEVLRILGSSLSEETKEAALRRLDGGKTWQHLLDNEMKTLRRATIRRFSKDETTTWDPSAGLQVLLPDLQSVSDDLMSRSPDVASSVSVATDGSGLIPRTVSSDPSTVRRARRIRI